MSHFIERHTTANIARDKARVLRSQVASMTSEGLEPLRAALRIRAGELELVAEALSFTPPAIIDLSDVAAERDLIPA